jgi:hypothetical protein
MFDKTKPQQEIFNKNEFEFIEGILSGPVWHERAAQQGALKFAQTTKAVHVELQLGAVSHSRAFV